MTAAAAAAVAAAVLLLLQLHAALSAASAASSDLANSTSKPFNIGLRHLRFLVSSDRSIVGYEQFATRDVLPFTATENNLKGSPGQGYCVTMGIGTPPQFFNILIDTGSSNFAVAGSPHRDIRKYFRAEKSSSIKWLNQLVYVPYTQGRWNGHLATDVVRWSFYPNRTITPYISVIYSSEQFFINTADWQGILGMAYSHIASPHSRIETLFDTMVRQWNIPNVFALQLCGTTRDAKNASSDRKMDGSLTLGGVDANLFNGQLLYVPIRKEWFYEVVIVDILINSKSLGMDCKEYNFDKSIVDSGTTDIRLPQRVFNRIAQRLLASVAGVGERFYKGETLLCLPRGTGPWDKFPIITVSLLYSAKQQIDLNLSPQQYLRYVGHVFDVPGKDCFKFGFQASDKGAILGAVFMEGYYVIFDRANRRLGFAQSKCNVFTTPSSPSSPPLPVSNITGPKAYAPTEFSASAWDCAFFQASGDDSVLLFAAVAMAILCVLCAVPVCAMFVFRQIRKCRQSHASSEKSPLVR